MIRPLPVRELVRIGDRNDGGYVIPRVCLALTTTLVSLGLGHNWSFDDEFAAASHAYVIGVDGSVTTWSFLRRSLQKFRHGVGYLFTLHPRMARARLVRAMHLVRWARRFHAGADAHGRILRRLVSNGAGEDYITVAGVLGDRDRRDGSLFLKMDIEGSEYDVLADIVERAASFNGLAIEFHDLDTKGAAFSDGVRALLKAFVIVHTHGNNNAGLVAGTTLPRTLELTFLNRMLLDQVTMRSAMPHYPIVGLDAPNNAKRAELPLSF
ncbi:MAG TPA: hypothetical protein VFW89_03850 [Gemmatimonadaceae bacterium]|nr:hypothetical protein [Gemmatimonadaceae bacterium]